MGRRPSVQAPALHIPSESLLPSCRTFMLSQSLSTQASDTDDKLTVELLLSLFKQFRFEHIQNVFKRVQAIPEP